MQAAAQKAVDRMKALMDEYHVLFGNVDSMPSRMQSILDQFEADSAAELEAMHADAVDFSGLSHAA